MDSKILENFRPIRAIKRLRRLACWTLLLPRKIAGVASVVEYLPAKDYMSVTLTFSHALSIVLS